MFNLQGSEIIVILLLALVVLGPEKLPEAVRKFTQTYSELKKMSSGFQSELKSALDELGYEPVIGAEHYQFRKEDPAGFIERGIKIDLLTGPSSSFDGSGLKIDERRVRPQPSVGVHAHPTDEAITLAENLQQVDLESNSTGGDSQR